MAFPPRISTLNSANLFWNRYSIEIAEHGRKDYIATFRNGKTIKAANLTLLWFELGDRLFRGGAMEWDNDLSKQAEVLDAIGKSERGGQG